MPKVNLPFTPPCEAANSLKFMRLKMDAPMTITLGNPIVDNSAKR